jgi:hypothetical protein
MLIRLMLRVIAGFVIGKPAWIGLGRQVLGPQSILSLLAIPAQNVAIVDVACGSKRESLEVSICGPL